MDQQAPPPDAVGATITVPQSDAQAIDDAPHRPSSVDEFEAAAPVLDPAAGHGAGVPAPVDRSPQLIDESNLEEPPAIPMGKYENDDIDGLVDERTQLLEGSRPPAVSTCEEVRAETNEMDDLQLQASTVDDEEAHAIKPVAPDDAPEVGGVDAVQLEMQGTQHLISQSEEEPALEWKGEANEMDDSRLPEDEDTYALQPVATDELLGETGGAATVQDEEGTREMEGTQQLGSPLAHPSAPIEESGEEPVSVSAAAAGSPDDSRNDMDREDAVQLDSKAEELAEDAALWSKSSGKRMPATGEEAVEMDVEKTERPEEVSRHRGSRKSKGRRKPFAGEDALEMDVEKMEEPGEECGRRGKRKGKGRQKFSLFGGSPSAANDDVAVEEDAIEMDKEETEEHAKEAAHKSRGKKRRNPGASDNSLTATCDTAVGENTAQMDMDEVEEPVSNSACGSRSGRKRGRPRRSQAMRAQPKRRQEKEDEEVCFICFDGGELVVCDRRGCPKVYHPSCVNRDEAFFRAKGRWNCGWHICSSCKKSAHYMCYTCTYSLCKGCISSELGFVRVRGDKGFCATCMSTVMMIESDDGNQKPGGIDFDDKTSWMYLFKDYWIDLKRKLSLTLEELTRAQAPQKDSNAFSSAESSDNQYDANVVREASSDSSGHFEESISMKKAKKQARNIADEENSGRKAESEGVSASEGSGWASKELLDFVGYMKDGDTSALSQFDVQSMLLDYIKQNNLRDLRRKSQIVCDSMLLNLFGKERVGHFEMLKLLESHFLMKEPSPVVTDDNQEGVVDPDPGQMDIEGNSDASTRTSSDKRRKTRKRLLEKEPQTNLDDYAAIDMHNINLMYLRRNLMEDLLDDDTFSEKVVGSFVRIRISGAGQRQDIYRLVQVVGVGRAAKKYKSGKKATDFTLEILNLNKTEFITIDIISNQEFTEEECKRLRQSIKCGFISRLTVGEVLEKAAVLQAVRATDWLESEKLRLGNLRDRASEQGRRKQLRECVEKLHLLSTPEERIRRLNEVPKIHDDPKMDPDYESLEDDDESEDKKEDNYDHLREMVFFGKRSEGTSPGKGGSFSRNNWDSAGKGVHTAWGNINMATESSWDVGSSTRAINRKSNSSLDQDKVQQTTNLEAPNAHMKAHSLEAGASNGNQLVMNSGQSSVVPFEGTSTPTLPGVLVSSNTSETEKMWHYQDPSGKVQGPFSMTQLRKWDSTGHFPSSLRIWRTFERQEDSILLNDALKGKFQKDLPKLEPRCNSSAQPLKFERVNGIVNNSYGGSGGNNISTRTDNHHNAENWKASHNDDCSAGTGNVGPSRSDIRTAQPSSFPTSNSEVNNRGDRSGGWQSFNNNNSWPGHSQGANSSRPMSPYSGNPYRSSYQGRGGRGRWHGGQDRQNNWNQNKTRGIQPGSHASERQQPSWSTKSSGGQWNNQPIDNPPNQVTNNSFSIPALLPSSMSLAAVQGAFMNSTNNPVQLMGSGWGRTPSSEVQVPPIVTMGASITAPIANPVGCLSLGSSPSLSMQVGNSLANVPAAVPNTSRMGEFADSVQTLGYLQMQGEQKKHSVPAAPIVSEGVQLSPWDENVSVKIASALDCSASTEFRSGMDGDQSSASACPIPSPTCKQGAGNVQPFFQSTEMQCHSVAGSNEPDTIKSSSEGDGRSAAENRMTSATGVVLNPTASSLTKVSYPQAKSAESEACQSLNAHSFNSADIKPGVVSDAVSIVPVQGSEASSTFTHKLDGSSHNLSASAGNICESNQSLRPEVSNSGPILAGSGNGEVPSENRSIQWTKSSLASAPNLLAQAASADPYPANGPNGHLVSTVGSQPPQLNVNTNTLPEQPSKSGSGAAQQISSLDTGTAQANGNMILGTALQGSASTGWGVVTQGNMDVVWGVPAQGNPNLAIGWGTAVQGDMNMDMPWGTPAQGNASTNAVWMALPQGSTSVNLNWGAPAHGTINLPGCSAPAMNQNIGWGVVAQTNANANWGAQQGNMNQTWNSNSLNTQQNQTTGRPGQIDAAFDSSNTAHGPGRRPWNRTHSDSREGPSRPAREEVGVCRFHENGHCKKGAYCNYIHM